MARPLQLLPASKFGTLEELREFIQEESWRIAEPHTLVFTQRHFDLTLGTPYMVWRPISHIGFSADLAAATFNLLIRRACHEHLLSFVDSGTLGKSPLGCRRADGVGAESPLGCWGRLGKSPLGCRRADGVGAEVRAQDGAEPGLDEAFRLHKVGQLVANGQGIIPAGAVAQVQLVNGSQPAHEFDNSPLRPPAGSG